MTRLEPNLRAPNLRAPNLWKGVATIMVALALTALAALPVGAETSAWTSKLDVPETAPAAPKGAGKSGTGEPRPAPVAKPATEPKRAAPPGEAAAKSAAKVATPQAPPREAGARANPAKPATIPNLPTALPPPVGETAAAAYELFDQGRFLSALATAVKAVQQKGEPEAYTLIGRIYEEGLGVGRNAEVAIEWYAQGAELGDLNAQFSLGLMYAEGRGAAKNLARAAAAFEASAKQGHQVAQYNLGMI